MIIIYFEKLKYLLWAANLQLIENTITVDEIKY